MARVSMMSKSYSRGLGRVGGDVERASEGFVFFYPKQPEKAAEGEGKEVSAGARVGRRRAA